MSTYLVTVVIENGAPDVGPDTLFYAVDALSREAAETRIREITNVPFLALASRALPQRWPEYEGEVLVI